MSLHVIAAAQTRFNYFSNLLEWIPPLKPIATQSDLFDLMAQHHVKLATLKFYDMADRYILRVGDQHISLAEPIANQLLTTLANLSHVEMTTENAHPAAIIHFP